MLYSAQYNFIYSKSNKTASTSCEAALEFLIRGDFAPHHTNSLVYEDGSRIGYRGNNPESDPNFGTIKFSKNHQSLKRTKKQITPGKFKSAYKISSIRNPYDRIVSHFHFFKGNSNPLDEFVELKRHGRINEIRRRFEDYLVSGPSAGICRHHWYVRSNMLIDKFIRSEFLREDLSDALVDLKVPVEISAKILNNIPQHKNSGRSDTCLNVADYFTDRSLEMINTKYSQWFSLGKYLKYNSIAELELSV